MESERIRKSAGDGNLEIERIRTTLHLTLGAFSPNTEPKRIQPVRRLVLAENLRSFKQS